MSPRARRLAAGVVVDRFDWQRGQFDWQRGPFAAAAVTPMLRRSEPLATTVAPAMRDLPSPTAERLQAIEREAFAKGYAEGERAAEAATAESLDAMRGRLAHTIDEVGGLRAGVMHRAERELVRLALSMAERVVRREIDIDRDLLAVMARVAIDRLGENAVATIHLNPADCDATMGRTASAPSGSVAVVADGNVPRGGCLVRSEFGTIDAGIESQMRELARALLGDDGGQEESAHGLASDV